MYSASSSGQGRVGSGAAQPKSAAPVSVSASTSWRSLSERVRTLVLEQAEDELGPRSYSPELGQEAAQTVAERVMLQLRESSVAADFKLIVNVVILQRIGAGLHAVSSCYWDGSKDGSTVVRWENATICAIITVYGIRLE